MDHYVRRIEDQLRASLRSAERQIPAFRAGDTIRVFERVVEGTEEHKERFQIFEGIVVKRQGSGGRASFTVRKLASGIGVEKTFPLYSPKISKIELVERGKARRARLYYLRRKALENA